MLEHNDRSSCESRKKDSASELDTSVFMRYSRVTGVSLWLLERPGGSFSGAKQASCRWWTHPEHVYHPPTDEGEHLVDDGLSQEKGYTRDVSGHRKTLGNKACAAFARLRSSLDDCQIYASKLRVCKQPKQEGPAEKSNRCCSRRSASTSSGGSRRREIK